MALFSPTFVCILWYISRRNAYFGTFILCLPVPYSEAQHELNIIAIVMPAAVLFNSLLCCLSSSSLYVAYEHESIAVYDRLSFNLR
jgi:hypothetical protein